MTTGRWELPRLLRIWMLVSPVPAVAVLGWGGYLLFSTGGPVWPRLGFAGLAVVFGVLVLRLCWWQAAWKAELTDSELILTGPRRTWQIPLTELTAVGRAFTQQQLYVATERERVYLAPFMPNAMQLVVELSRRRPELTITGS